MRRTTEDSLRAVADDLDLRGEATAAGRIRQLLAADACPLMVDGGRWVRVLDAGRVAADGKSAQMARVVPLDPYGEPVGQAYEIEAWRVSKKARADLLELAKRGLSPL